MSRFAHDILESQHLSFRRRCTRCGWQRVRVIGVLDAWRKISTPARLALSRMSRLLQDVLPTVSVDLIVVSSGLSTWTFS